MGELFKKFLLWFSSVADNLFYDPHLVDPKTLPMNQDTSPEPKNEPVTQTTAPSLFATLNAQKLYERAKFALGSRITLDPTVSPDLGCAEAVSFLLSQVISGIPAKGFAGTAQLFAFMISNKTVFEQIGNPEPGAIIISPTGSPGAKLPHGHVGVCAFHGILSNNSYTGLFDETLNVDRWRDFYHVRGGFPIYYFRLK